jgi:hypothetical protein
MPFGILRKGVPYAPPENYETPEAQARRKRLEHLRREEERRHAEEAEIEELEFRAWKAGLTMEKRRELVPWAKQDGSPNQEAGLREYFRNQKQRGVSEGDKSEQLQIAEQVEASLGSINLAERNA